MTGEPPALEYATTPARHRVSWERNGGELRIIVPGPRCFPRWVGDTDLLFPLAMLACLLVRLVPIKRKPRALIELTHDTFTVIESFDGFETSAKESWPRAQIAELRPNRYSSGV